MTFAIEGGGVSRAIKVFFFKFLQKPSRITPWLPKRVLHIVWALYYVYIVDEVTMNMAEYGSWRSQQSANVNFDPIIRGLKRDIFVWDQVYNPFHICKIQLQKKKKWGEKWIEIRAI